MRRTFEVDKAEAKLMGVCSGLARMTGVDATVIRIGFVVATLIGGWPWTVVAYVVLALAGKPKRTRVAASARRASLEERGAMSDLDRRLAEVDHYVASSNDRLAREIEELR
ncbi:MAG TPA: PspC domain-containing protein [Allosphingosinicella sp.]